MSAECKDCVYIKNISEKVDKLEGRVGVVESDVGMLKTDGAVRDVKHEQLLEILSEIKQLQKDSNLSVLEFINKTQMEIQDIKNKPDSFQVLKEKITQNIIVILLTSGIFIGGVIYALFKAYNK